MPDTPEHETNTVIGESGIIYENTRIPDELSPGRFTDHIILPADPVPTIPPYGD